MTSLLIPFVVFVGLATFDIPDSPSMIKPLNPCSGTPRITMLRLASFLYKPPHIFLFSILSSLRRLALEWSGLDLDYVILEDQRCRKQAFRLCGATRSGIDESVLDSPSIRRLRCRRYSQTYCNNHNRSFFKAIQTHGME